MFEIILDTYSEKYHQKKGIKFLSRAKYQKSLHHFEKALLINDSTVNNFYYSISLIALNRHSEAITFLEKIIDSHTNDILISSTLTECYLAVREWEKAEHLADYLLEKFKENTFIQKLHSITNDVVLREKYAAAKESFYKTIENMDNKDYEAAFLEINKAIEMDEENASYYFLAGTILMQANRKKEEYVLYYEKAVLLAPKNESYKKHLRYVKTRL